LALFQRHDRLSVALRVGVNVRSPRTGQKQ
jgi:hypothetical protein